MGKMDCTYCGESTYIERISGRDACSYCGAGIDAVSAKQDAAHYEEHAAIVGTSVAILDSMKTYTKETKSIKKTRTPAPSYRKRRQSGGLSADKVFAGVFLFFIVLAVFAPTMRNVMYVETPGDREKPSMVEIGLRVDLIDAETGMHNNYEARLEILNDDDIVGYMFMLKNTALFEIIAQENMVYWVRMFPYQNSTYSERSFKAIANETQLITFAIY